MMISEAMCQTTIGALEPRVAVVGVGGAGCNVVNDMYWADGSIDSIAINSDKLALTKIYADKKVCISDDETTSGTAGNVLVGKELAKAQMASIEEAVAGYDAVFVIAGVGGGTGSGVSPVVLDIAERLGSMTFAIMIKPFSFESARMKASRDAIAQIKGVCRQTTIVENDLVLQNNKDCTLVQAFRMVNSSINRHISEVKKKIEGAFNDSLFLIDDAEGASIPSGELPVEMHY